MKAQFNTSFYFLQKSQLLANFLVFSVFFQCGVPKTVGLAEDDTDSFGQAISTTFSNQGAPIIAYEDGTVKIFDEMGNESRAIKASTSPITFVASSDKYLVMVDKDMFAKNGIHTRPI